MKLDKLKEKIKHQLAGWQAKLSPVLESTKEYTSKLSSKISRHKIQDVAGIDIGSDTIKLIQLKPNGDNISICAFSTVPLPGNIIVKDEIKDPNALSELIKELALKSNINTSNIALAISRSSVMIKQIQVNRNLNHHEIESRAWVEANRLFPDLVGNIYLDFSIGKPGANKEDPLDLTLVACRKDVINPYIDTFKQAGFNVCVVDVNCYAMQRAIPYIADQDTDKAKTLAILNINETLMSLLVKQGDKLIYAHDQSYDGQRLKKFINEYTKAHPEPIDTNNEAYIQGMKESLGSHLRHSLHLFISSHPNTKINKLFFSGEYAGIEGMNKVIQQETGTETEVADPLKHISLSDNVDATLVNQNRHALIQCIGLALAKY